MNAGIQRPVYWKIVAWKPYNRDVSSTLDPSEYLDEFDASKDLLCVCIGGPLKDVFTRFKDKFPKREDLRRRSRENNKLPFTNYIGYTSPAEITLYYKRSFIFSLSVELNRQILMLIYWIHQLKHISQHSRWLHEVIQWRILFGFTTPLGARANKGNHTYMHVS